jgi:hypothetical protein
MRWKQNFGNIHSRFSGLQIKLCLGSIIILTQEFGSYAMGAELWEYSRGFVASKFS